MTLGLPVATLFSFLLVLARVGGVVAFLPMPGWRAAPDSARVVLALAMTVALFPVWPALPDTEPAFGKLAAWAFVEAGFGVSVGVAVALLVEGFQIAAQIVGLQAGYGYSLTVDPSSQADSGVLQVILALVSGLLAFTLGIHRELIRVLALSLERLPAGSWHATAAGAEGIVRLGSNMLSTGLRLALPVVALLLLIDLALALLSRMQQQLQLLSLAFPVKMLAALVILAALAPVVPRLLSGDAERMLEVLAGALR
jgi:flagellar biosynthetic protein FliR